MDTADIKAVLLETPDLSDAVRELFAQGGITGSDMVDRINFLLRNHGWEWVEVDLDFVLNLYDEFYPLTEINDIVLQEPPIGKISLSNQDKQENSKVSIKKVTYVDGNDIKFMSVDEFLNAIKKTDAEIKRLTEMNIDSVAVTAEIDRLKEDRAELITLLDAQHKPKETPSE